MKKEVTLTHSVTLFVEGTSEDEIQDWLNNTTPSEARDLAESQGHTVEEHYAEEIQRNVGDDVFADYIIPKEG